MAKTFHLTVAKVGETVFDGEALSVLLPGADGVFQVLSGHEALVAELSPGDVIVVDQGGEKHTLPLERPGVAEVSSNQVTVLL